MDKNIFLEDIPEYTFLPGVSFGQDNLLCENLKKLHANLNHLIWQAKQVASGDYSQYVSCLREFSEAFNTMTEQLCEQERLLRQEAARLADQAYLDLLTHIGNRFYFEEQMEKLLKRKNPFVLCYFDLDHLKYVNDRYGHAQGDEYIQRFVRTVQGRIRDDDIFARIGGDEFCAVFQGCPKEAAHEKLEQILGEFRTLGGSSYPSSFSYGIIVIGGDGEDLSVSSILERADAAMYERKRMNKQMYEKVLAGKLTDS